MTQHVERLITQIMMPETDRIKRLPFDEWQVELTDMLQRYETETSDMEAKFESMAVLTNQLSLVLVYLGEISRSEQMISSAMSAFISAGEKFDSNKIRDFAFQPWVNQGRIYRLQGKYEAACKIFNDVNINNESDYLLIGANKVHKSAVNDKAILNILDNIHVMDTLKSLVQAKNSNGLADFLGNNADLQSSNSAFIREGKIILEYLKGDKEKAAELGAEAAWFLPPDHMTTAQLR